MSSLSVVPKKTSREYRLIHHLSYPNGDSVNDGISSDYSAVNYACVDDAIAMIKLLGCGCFLAKTDIKSAFRIIPVWPSDYDLLGIFGKENIIIRPCLWAVHHAVEFLQCSARLSNGLLRNIFRSHI